MSRVDICFLEPPGCGSWIWLKVFCFKGLYHGKSPFKSPIWENMFYFFLCIKPANPREKEDLNCFGKRCCFSANYSMNRPVVSGYKWFLAISCYFHLPEPLSSSQSIQTNNNTQRNHPEKVAQFPPPHKNETVILVGVGLLSTPRYSVDSQKTHHFNQ